MNEIIGIGSLYSPLLTRVHRMTKHDYYSYIKIKQLYFTYKCFAHLTFTVGIAATLVNLNPS
jgi:hypothetical protein